MSPFRTTRGSTLLVKSGFEDTVSTDQVLPVKYLIKKRKTKFVFLKTTTCWPHNVNFRF